MLEYVGDEYVSCNNYFITRHNIAVSFECAFFIYLEKEKKKNRGIFKKSSVNTPLLLLGKTQTRGWSQNLISHIFATVQLLR